MLCSPFAKFRILYLLGNSAGAFCVSKGTKQWFCFGTELTCTQQNPCDRPTLWMFPTSSPLSCDRDCTCLLGVQNGGSEPPFWTPRRPWGRGWNVSDVSDGWGLGKIGTIVVNKDGGRMTIEISWCWYKPLRKILWKISGFLWPSCTLKSSCFPLKLKS